MPNGGPNLRSFSVRAGVLALLLGAEVLLLQLQLDSETIIQDGSLAARVLVDAFRIVPFGIAFAVAFLIFTGFTRIRETLEAPPPGYRWYRYLVVHLVAYSLLAWLSFVVFRERGATPLRTITWISLVCLTGISWALSFASWNSWRRLFEQETGTFAAAGLTAFIASALGATTSSLWDRLAPYTLWASYAILVCLFDEVTCDVDERSLGVADFSVQIAPECSGYEGIGIVAVFLTAYILLFRSQLKFPNAFLLPVIGIVASWCGNALRIAALIVIGASISSDLALGGFHSQAGWIITCTVALCLVAISRRVRFFAGDVAQNDVSSESASHADAYLLPFLAGVASGMLTEAVGLDTNRSYVLRTCIVLAILLWYRTVYFKLPMYRSWQSVGLGLVVFLVWRLLVTPAANDAGLSDANAVSPDFIWFPLRCVWYVALIPIVEELAFRKYLIDRLRSLSFGFAEPYKLWIAVGVSATCFGLLHGANWMPGVVAGTLFGVAYLRRDSVLDAVIAHSVCNGTIAAYSVLTNGSLLWR